LKPFRENPAINTGIIRRILLDYPREKSFGASGPELTEFGMNSKKGFLRITLVLSAVPALAGFIVLLSSTSDSQAEAGLMTMVGGPALVWVIYLAVSWIVKGFKDQK
jgi:hypothetical protein